MPNVPVTGGSGNNIATNTVTRDAVTEHMQLMNIADPSAAAGNCVSVLAPGSSGSFALSVQGTTGGLALPTTTIPQSFAVTTGNISATGSGSAISATTIGSAGMAQVSIHGTYGIATFQFQASDDSGTTWYPIQGIRSDGTYGESLTNSIAANSSVLWSFGLGGITNIRVYAVTLASGTVNVRITPVGGSVVDPSVYVSGGNINLGGSSVSTRTTVALTTTVATVLAANTARKMATLFNTSATTAALVGLGAANATSTDYSFSLAAGSFYELPINYTGAITALTASGTASLNVSELT